MTNQSWSVKFTVYTSSKQKHGKLCKEKVGYWAKVLTSAPSSVTEVRNEELHMNMRSVQST